MFARSQGQMMASKVLKVNILESFSRANVNEHEDVTESVLKRSYCTTSENRLWEAWLSAAK